MNLLLAVAIILFTYLYLLFFVRTHLTRTARLANKFPGGWIIPFIGNAALFLGTATEVPKRLSKYVKKFGKCCVLWKLDNPWIIIADANVAEKILSSSRLIDKGKEYEPICLYMGTGLLTSNQEKWRCERKLLNPAFKMQMFDKFFDSFNEQSNILVQCLNDKFPLGSNEMIKDVHSDLGKCTMEIALESTLGKRLDLQRTTAERRRDYLNSLYIMVESIRLRMTKPWLTLPVIWNIFGTGLVDLKTRNFLREELRSMIEERQRGLRNLKAEQLNLKDGKDGSKLNSSSFMDILLSTEMTAGDPENLVDHSMNFLGAGSETAATAMTFALFLLATNPKVQKLIQIELDEIFAVEGNEGIIMREVTPKDLPRMKYLEMSIKEAMRLYPPVPIITRNLNADVPLDNGLTIPMGSDAVFLLYDLHRDPEVYPDPEAFKPERFFPEDAACRSLYSYLPFSAGIRNCIGHKYAVVMMKVIMAKILWSFEVRTDQRREDLRLMYGMTIEVNPILLSLKRRRRPLRT